MGRLLNAVEFNIDTELSTPGAVPSGVCRLGAIYMPLDDLIDVEAERARLSAKLDQVQSGLRRAALKLNDEKFASRAPAEVIARQRTLCNDLEQDAEKLESMIANLPA